ncbi:MAG: glycosyltransferase, partial [Pseudomonadota bacterium]
VPSPLASPAPQPVIALTPFERQGRDVARALSEAQIAHTGLGDLYRPINKDALDAALARPVTTVFVRDTDEVTKFRNLIASGLMRNGPDRVLYLRMYERVLHRAVAKADLTMLKGRALYDRYAPVSGNPRMIQDTSYRSSEIVAQQIVEARLAARGPGAALRLVYCGRLVARKGLDHSIDIVAQARAQGANVTFDLIGNGEERDRLEAQVARAGLQESVRFLGEKSYGPDLLRTLADYDALLFTPLSEDTPRMIFDGYAAGLPLIGYDIPYVQERAQTEKAALLLPSGDQAGAAARLAQVAGDPGQLATLTRAAHQAAHANATDVWYKQRADWTLEAHERRLHTNGPGHSF